MEKDQFSGSRRTENRFIADQIDSVQLAIQGVPALYHFRVWNLSTRGLCIVVQQSSTLLRHLRSGQELRMSYYSAQGVRNARELNTRISHITPQTEGRFRGHCLVGLMILEDSRLAGGADSSGPAWSEPIAPLPEEGEGKES